MPHNSIGYLAQPYSVTDLAAGIDWVLNAPNYNELCQNAREKVLREFDSQVVAGKYVELYERVMKGEG
jgi:glycosyltransferase involved in cell wall biosynthesis